MHNRRSRAGLGPAILLAVLVLACGEPPVQASRGTASLPEVTPEARAAIEVLAQAFEPVDPTLTSDHQDRHLLAQREQVAAAIRAASPAIAAAALERLDSDPEQPFALRVTLLEVAVAGAREATSERLENLVSEYDVGAGMGLRGAAVRILAETAPERAMALLAPMIRGTRQSVTLPPSEELLRGWVLAARTLGLGDERLQEMLVDVAVNLRQGMTVRHYAIEELGQTRGLLGQRALEELLVESSSNGYLRRKAAQGLARMLPPGDLCPILERVADRETDEIFLYFLADLLERDCP